LTADPSELWREPQTVQALIHDVAGDLFRVCLSGSGFVAADLGSDVDPSQFRSMLIGFTAALDEAYQRGFSRRLILRSVGRFDQKVSTEAHLDGATDESILILGYEPSEIVSRLFLIDYTKCAAEKGLEPRAFLDRFNPTFGDGRALLENYTTEVSPFESRHYRIVVINNSSRPLESPAQGMLGLMHKSTVICNAPRRSCAQNSGSSRTRRI
jgi:hypothetical protein